jgi:hypothetical protein
MAPGKMIKLEIGGQSVTVVVEREQLANDLAACGYPSRPQRLRDHLERSSDR